MVTTIDHHDLRKGGAVHLSVATPTGTVHGRWVIHDVDPPSTLRFTFSSDGLEPTELTVHIATAPDATTTLTITASFTTDAALRHALDIDFPGGLARSCASAHLEVGSWQISPGAT